MKLTTKQFDEASAAHELYWKSYLVGDIETLASLLDEGYTQVGSVENEVFSNKKDAIQFLVDTIDQVAGNLEMRNRITTSESIDGLILFHEQCDLYVLSEEGWVLYSKFRASSLLKEHTIGWKLIHQHSSLPDSKAEAGDNIALEKISEENLMLRDAVKRRTLELENKTRDLEIEAALDRVRNRSLTMHKSDELAETATVMFQQLKSLEVETYSSGITLWEKDGKEMVNWVCRPDGTMNPPFKLTIAGDPWHARQYESWEKGEAFIVKDLAGEEMQEHFRYLRTYPLLDEAFEKIIASGHPMPDRQIHHVANFSHGNLLFISLKPYPEAHDIFMRFAKVFEQTYTRFLDLQKAEAQAREAEIELALERVRARTMAMQKSEELSEVAALLFKQLKILGADLWSAIIAFCKEDELLVEKWGSSPITGQFFDPVFIPFNADHGEESMYNTWKNKTDLYSYVQDGKELKDIYDHLMTIPSFKASFQKVIDAGRPLPVWQKNHVASFKYGYLLIITENEFKEEYVFTKFAKVFEQTYTRFLDLQKAEAQTREAEIELALERVRARTMAMGKSPELAEVVAVIYKEIEKLGLADWGCNIQIMNEADHTIQFWLSSSNADFLPNCFYFQDDGHPGIKKQWENYKNKLPKSILALKGKDKVSYDDYVLNYTDFKYFPEPLKENIRAMENVFFSYSLMKYGFISSIKSDAPLTEDEFSILSRFAKVFEQTYTRFLDLQKAEAQAKQVVKQASLDRVRGEIASMRTTKDLERITPLIWKELSTLGVPFFRCGVFIMDEENQVVHTYLSSPSGENIAAIHLAFDNDIALVENGLQNWRSQSVHIETWSQQQFIDFAQTLIEQGQVTDRKKYQQGETPPEKLVLHLVPFKQGMLYVGNVEPLNQEQIELVQTLADSFSIAYSRYEDFNALEIAKGKIENTLGELKATQDQLIQQEKLASLGQLTAGIAHEIKNPLNFVNNFSDLSRELIEEVFEELKNLESSETKQEIIAILQDVQSNLTKVHEHGSRADSIVTSMLQHSRASGSKREPKPFNPLVKEFVNLSFHGMRAGKAPINVDIDLQLDDQIGDVTLISEDFSRVILNLCNNAFDAMRDKLKLEVGSGKSEAYLPKLTVTTALQKDQVILSISDNGGGIPEEIRDKILQPFFTTKKGTEGTGLGLSITHDIVKAHGGELDIQSQPGNTIFKIHLTL